MRPTPDSIGTDEQGPQAGVPVGGEPTGAHSLELILERLVLAPGTVRLTSLLGDDHSARSPKTLRILAAAVVEYAGTRQEPQRRRIVESLSASYPHFREPLAEAMSASVMLNMELERAAPTPHATRVLPAPFGPKLAAGDGYRYELLEVLGIGGTGVVYRGIDQLLTQQSGESCEVAIKVFFAGWSDPSAALTEAAAAMKVQSPHAVRVLHADLTEEGIPYIVSELVLGHSLGRNPPSSQREALRLVSEVASAAAAAHALGIVHCDIKPDNVIVDCARRARLADFGASRRVSSVERARSATIGFSAPEQFDLAGPIGPQADCYALGALMWWCATREPPPCPTGRLIPLLPGSPRRLQRLCAKCLSLDPAQRPPDAAAFLAEFQRAQSKPVGRQAFRVGAVGLLLAILLWAVRLMGLSAGHRGSDGRAEPARQEVARLEDAVISARAGDFEAVSRNLNAVPKSERRFEWSLLEAVARSPSSDLPLGELISVMSFSRDGDRLAVGTATGRVAVLDVANWRVIRSAPVSRACVSGLKWYASDSVPHHEWIAVTVGQYEHPEARVLMLDWPSLDIIRSIDLPATPTEVVLASNEGPTVFAVSARDNQVRFLDLALREIGNVRFDSWPDDIDCDSTSGTMVVGEREGRVCLRRGSTEVIIPVFESERARHAMRVAVQPGGRFALAASDATDLRLVSLFGKYASTSLSEIGQGVRAMRWIDADIFAVGRANGTIEIRALNAPLEPKLVLRAGARSVRAMAVSPDGALLASGGDDGILRVWHVGAIRQAMADSPQTAADGMPLASNHWTGVMINAWHEPDGEILAAFSSLLGDITTVSVKGSVRHWSVEGGQDPQRSAAIGGVSVVAAAVGAAGTVISTGDAIMTLPMDGRSLGRIDAASQHLTIAAAAPLIAAVASDGSVQVLDFPSLDRRFTLQNVGHEARAALSADGTLLLIVRTDGVPAWFETSIGRKQGEMASLHSIGTAAALTADGRYAIIGLADNTTRVVDLDRTIETLRVEHSAPPTAIVEIAFNRFLVSGRDMVPTIVDVGGPYAWRDATFGSGECIGVAYPEGRTRLTVFRASGSIERVQLPAPPIAHSGD